MRNIVTTLLLALAAVLPLIAEPLVLENAHVRLAFGTGPEFRLLSFQEEGVEILPEGGSSTHPWVITLLGPGGENPSLQPRFSWYDGGKAIAEDTLEFTWRLFLDGKDSWPVVMRVSLKEGATLPVFSLEASLPEGWVITQTEFPRIGIRRTEGMKAVLPIGFGAEYSVEPSGQLQCSYPSCTGGMQLVLLHDERGTVFFSALDKKAAFKKFTVNSEGKQAVLIQETTASYAWSEGGHFSLPWDTVLGFTRKSWEETALAWYRPFTFETEWGAKTLKERKITPWIEHADMWLRPADATPEMMEAVRQALAFYGKGTGLHWYYWHKHPFDTNYPDYFPAQEGFDEMVKESRKLGGYVTPYINGRLWDPANATYEALGGKEASCRKPDGSLYTEVYSSKAVNTVTCPASPIWQNVLKDLNKRILKELGTNGVYMDQIGAAICEPCYAPGHSHAPGGGSWWPEAYRDLLTSMRNSFYRSCEAMTTEENAECYIDLFDMMLVVNSPHASYMKMVPLFPLIYSDRCVVSGYTYIPWRLNDGSMDFISMQSLLWGSQLGWVNPQLLMKEENRSQAEFLRTLTAFRKANHDLFFGGRFLGSITPEGDNPVQTVPGYQESPVVMAARWSSIKGTPALVLVNMDTVEHRVSIEGREVTVQARSAVRISL